MALSSITFIFIFIPTFLLLFYILPFSNWRNSVLVLASLIFIAWTDLVNLPVLICITLFTYTIGMLIGRLVENKKKVQARALVWFAVVVNLLPLLFFKYSSFIVQTMAALARIEIAYEPKTLPLGISYFTFSAISYLIDVYHATEKPEKNIIRFSSFLIMFPKFLQGPITRFGQVKTGLINPKFNLDRMIQGARRFIAGLAKKVLLADSLSMLADKILQVDYSELGANLAWVALISYALQIYFDFSGYTDMALGLGKMIGLDLPENFNFPYVSRSITDFWRRWHMSLTSWFRTYIFIPLEFARKHEKFLRQQTNILIVFLLTGLWHGASWNFVIWGGYFGLILAIEASGFGKILKKAPRLLQHVYTMGVVLLGWVFFRITDIGDWGAFMNALFGGNGLTSSVSLQSLMVLFYLPSLFIGILFCLPLFSSLEKQLETRGVIWRFGFDILYLGLFILSVSAVLSNGFNAFIYAQF